jgi:hypothetical protein
MTVSPEFVDIRTLLVIIAVLLALILWKLNSIAGRLKERFPTAKEEDYKWSQDDPMGHWEAHKDDKK